MNLIETNKAISLISQQDQNLLLTSINSANQIILIGNGGSNAIASHIAVDYIKFLNKKSLAFSDPSMLTASMNDYGTENAYAKYIDSYKDNNTLVILISSSGNSLYGNLSVSNKSISILSRFFLPIPAPVTICVP